LVRFDGFAFDIRAGELCRDGTPLKLQPQPAKILALLISRAGDVVTREEIVREVWGSDTFVDFEQGLNYAIRQIRGVLKDDAENPRFIETLPKRGYRFVAAIDEPGTNHELCQPTIEKEAPAEASSGLAGIAVEELRDRPGAVQAPPKKARFDIKRRWRLKLTALALLAGAALIAYLLRPLMPPLQVTSIVQLTKSGEAWSHSLLTDGPRVYYLGTHGDGFQLKQVLLNGNEDTVVPGVPYDLLVIGLSPDDTEFLVRAEENVEDPLMTLPVIGGRPRRIGNLVVSDAAWSHDGRVLAYAHDHQLFVANPDGTGSRLLASLSGYTYHIRWAPDDSRLRFTVVGSTKKRMLWEVGADGSRLHEMQFNWPGNPMECCGEWTPDGHYFLFESHREGADTSNMWAIEDKSDWLHRANHEPVQLTVGPVNYYELVPSRNGKRVFAIGMQPGVDLLRYDAVQKDFVPFLGGLSAEHLDFTRDGEWMTYVAFPEGTLWKARSDGSEPVQLTFPPLRVALPRWSPDAKRIAFSGKRPGELDKIYTIASEGGNPESFTAAPQPYADWMPSGDAVIYGCYPNVKGCADAEKPLYQLDLRNGQSQKLSATAGLFNPRWSADGRHLVAINASYQLFLVDLKAGKRTRISSHTAEFPVWSPDSQYVYFNTIINDNLALFRIRVHDWKEEEVANVHFRTVTGHAASTAVPPGAVAPDGSPILQRSANHRDLYALSVSRPQ
jgi:DNA-binding winged helix-turn-helix (wHTH) protein/Tol biopolymer transport system component